MMPAPKRQPLYEIEGTYEKAVLDAFDAMEAEEDDGFNPWGNGPTPILPREAGEEVDHV